MTSIDNEVHCGIILRIIKRGDSVKNHVIRRRNGD